VKRFKDGLAAAICDSRGRNKEWFLTRRCPSKKDLVKYLKGI